MNFIILSFFILTILALNCEQNEYSIDVRREVGIFGLDETWSLYEGSKSGKLVYSSTTTVADEYKTQRFEICMKLEANYFLELQSKEPGGWYSYGDSAWIIFSYNDYELYRATFEYQPEKQLTHKSINFKLSFSTMFLRIHSAYIYSNHYQYDTNWQLPLFIPQTEWISKQQNIIEPQMDTRYYRYTINSTLNNSEAILVHVYTTLGFIVYINGISVFRFNLPEIPIVPSHHSTTYNNKPQWFSKFIPVSMFISSTDSVDTYIIAIETHMDNLHTIISDPFDCYIQTYTHQDNLPLSIPASVSCSPGSKLPTDSYGQCSDLFDNSYNSMFYGKSANTEITIHFKGQSQYKLSMYTLVNSVKKYSPTSWDLYGSKSNNNNNDNNDEWILLDTQHDIQWISNIQSKTFTLSSNNIYWDAVKLVIHSTVNNDFLQITSFLFSYMNDIHPQHPLSYDQYTYSFNEMDSFTISPSSSYSFSIYTISPLPLLPLLFNNQTGQLISTNSTLSYNQYRICGFIHLSNLPTCVEISIQIYSYCHHDTLWPDIVANHQFIYPCPTNFTGYIQRECTSNNEWTDIVNTCEYQFCSEDGIWYPTLHDTSLSLPCPPMYIGMQTRYCNSSKEWEDINIQCVRYACEDEEVEGIHWETTLIDTYREYECFDTTHYSGRIYRYCNGTTGQWSNVINECIRTHCDQEGIWNTSLVNTTIILPCEDSINYSGNQIRTCTLNGWNEPQNYCILNPLSLTYPINSIQGFIYSAIPVVIPTFSGGGITHFSINGHLPKGLKLNKSNGMISGTPKELYNSIVKIKLTNKLEESLTATITIVIQNVVCESTSEWNETTILSTQYKWCPSPYSGVITRYCSPNKDHSQGEWMNTDSSHCTDTSMITLPPRDRILMDFTIDFLTNETFTMSNPQTYENIRELVSIPLSIIDPSFSIQLIISKYSIQKNTVSIIYNLYTSAYLLDPINTYLEDYFNHNNTHLMDIIQNHKNNEISSIYSVTYSSSQTHSIFNESYLYLWIIITCLLGMYLILFIFTLLSQIYNIRCSQKAEDPVKPEVLV
ncbi:hypothetical protein WA158_000927 [Blastocystis sp. Blastoise]